MTFEFDFILVGLMQIFGFLFRAVRDLAVRLSLPRLQTDFWEQQKACPMARSSRFRFYTIWE